MSQVLANKDGIAIVIALMIHSGGMCPKCGHGTRATSRKWAKCKKCGERVERRELEAAAQKGDDRT